MWTSQSQDLSGCAQVNGNVRSPPNTGVPLFTEESRCYWPMRPCHLNHTLEHNETDHWVGSSWTRRHRCILHILGKEFPQEIVVRCFLESRFPDIVQVYTKLRYEVPSVLRDCSSCTWISIDGQQNGHTSTQMSIDTHVSNCANEALSPPAVLAVWNVLFRFRIPILLRHPKVNDMDVWNT